MTMRIAWFIVCVAITIGFIVTGAPLWVIVANVVLDALIAVSFMLRS